MEEGCSRCFYMNLDHSFGLCRILYTDDTTGRGGSKYYKNIKLMSSTKQCCDTKAEVIKYNCMYRYTQTPHKSGKDTGK